MGRRAPVAVTTSLAVQQRDVIVVAVAATNQSAPGDACDATDARPCHDGHMAEVKDNPEGSQYEIYVDGSRIGLMTYRISGDTVTTPHTEINPAYGGQGLGRQLVKGALDHIRDTGMFVRPSCPFVRAYIEQHAEYQDLVKQG